MSRRVVRWALVAAWAVLPLTAGTALDDALSGWATGPRVVAAVLAWLGWALGLLATLVPRPLGLTALRTMAPLTVVVALAVAVRGEAGAGATVLAVLGTLLVAVLVALPSTAVIAVNAIAYGDEVRTPLRTPPALYLGPLPLARLAIGAAVASGPLLLSDGQVAAGLVALVVGAPVVVTLGRSLHGVSRRWVVLVPAGLVVADPFTLSDPVLFLRDRLVAVRAERPDAPVPEGVEDLRLGAAWGTISIIFDRDAELFRAARGRHPATTVRARGVLVAVAGRAELLALAASRRLPVA